MKMKSKIGIIVLIIAIGLTIITCDGNNNNNNNIDVITGSGGGGGTGFGTGGGTGSGQQGGWVDPCTQTKQLTGGTELLSYTPGGGAALSGSRYWYETWNFTETASGGNKFTWYGPNQGGGGAFKAEWAGGYYLARLGYRWGNGGRYTQYNNIYIDYNYRKSGSAPWGYIGMYGWSRNSSASDPIYRLIEYYIVDDWFSSNQIGLGNITSGTGNGPGEELGSFVVDGATYKIYTNRRTNQPSIDGNRTFIQLFSIRQGRRTAGTISVTEHLKEWSKYMELGNLYEVTFKAESGGGNGNLDLSYLYLSMENTPRDASQICTHK